MVALVAARQICGAVGLGRVAPGLRVCRKLCSQKVVRSFVSGVDHSYLDAASGVACLIPGGGAVCGRPVTPDGLDRRLLEALRGHYERDCGCVAELGDFAQQERWHEDLYVVRGRVSGRDAVAAEEVEGLPGGA